jgi:hypothetical protein
MKTLTVSLLLITYSLTSWCQYPRQYIQNLQHVAQVTFPGPPTVDSLTTNLSYRLVNEKVMYIASCSRTKQNFGGTINSVYDGAINDMTDVTHGTIVYKKDITEQGLQGIEVETHSTDSSKDFYLFFRIFYFNDVEITQGMMFPKEVQRSDSRINLYFSTFKLLIKPNYIRQNTSVSALAVLKYALMILLVLAAIIAFIVFLTRRSYSKQKQ